MAKHSTVYDRFFVLNQGETLNEVHHWLQEMFDNFPLEQLKILETDVINLFNGDYPGYRYSNTSYHDLPHTLAVYLATLRLIHGAWLSGKPITMAGTFNGLAASLLHDVGLIQTIDDIDGTGAKYTQGHEQRSMEFAQSYFARPDRNFPEVDLGVVNKAIACTILSMDPSEIKFSSDESRIMGFAVGATDLYAQMADRAYLEKLLLLYDEFSEANIPGYSCPLELLQKTQGFWDYVVRPRIQEKMDNIGDYFIDHFRQSIDYPENLYLVSIKQNLEYLQNVLEQRTSDYKELLRRTSELMLD